MSESIIFCGSYPQITNALYFVTKRSPDHPVTILINSNRDLLKFLQTINEKVFQNRISFVFYDSYQGQAAKAGGRTKKALHLLADMIRERRHLRGIYYRHFSNLDGAEVIFFGRCFDPYQFYMLKRLSQRNRLVYMPDPSYVTPIRRSIPRNLKEFVNHIRCKAVYGFDIAIGEVDYYRNILYMPDRFFRKKVSKVITPEERDSMLKDFDLSAFKVFDTGDYKVIYFHQDLVDVGYILDPDTLKKEMACVFAVLARHIPERQIAYKHHPNFAGDRSIIAVGDELPDWIPAELLRNENTKIYLSMCSMAIANLEKGVAVSLLDLVTFRDDQTREHLRGFLKGVSRSEILFPKSLDEFERILISVKKQTSV